MVIHPTRGNPSVRDIRRINRRTVLEQVYFAPGINRLAVSQASGLSPATITNVVTDLLDEGVLIEAGVLESQGGRPRTVLTPNPAHGAFVGVDLGETHVQCELFDLALHQLAAIEHPLGPEENQPARVVELIAHSLEALLSQTGIKRDRLLGMGIGVPGIVDQGEGVTVCAPGWGWQPVPLLDLLQKQLVVPIALDNGAKAMAQAEMWFGAGQGAESVAVLLIGTGVGAGIMAQGTLYRGISNSAGEWGHTTIAIDGRSCRCGSQGCLESYIGAPGILATLRERAPQHPSLQHGDERSAVAAIVEAAGKGDPAAQATLTQTLRYLGAGIANLINTFNPQRIVVGGWVGQLLGPSALPQLQTTVARYALAQPLRAATLGLCQLGDNAVCMGAATLAVEQFLFSG